MNCTRCRKSQTTINSTVKVSYVSYWKIHEGGGRYYTRHWSDSAVRWPIALCADCANASVREGLAEKKQKAIRFIQWSPVLIVIFIITGVVSLFGLLPGVFASAFMILLVLQSPTRDVRCKDEGTRLAIQALGNSGAIEAVPMLIAVLERDEANFLTKFNAEMGLRRLTFHRIKNKEIQFDPFTQSSDVVCDPGFREDAKKWRRWWETQPKENTR